MCSGSCRRCRSATSCSTRRSTSSRRRSPRPCSADGRVGYSDVVTADLVYLVAGGSLLLAVVLPELLDRWAVSAPMVLVTVGLLIGLTPLPDGMPLDPQENRATIEHVTELVVIVALMGVGLALDRPLELRSRRSWGRWRASWLLLGVSM